MGIRPCAQMKQADHRHIDKAILTCPHHQVHVGRDGLRSQARLKPQEGKSTMKTLLRLTVFLFLSLSVTTSYSRDIESYNIIDLGGLSKDSTIEQHLSPQRSASNVFAENKRFQDMLGQLNEYCPTCVVVPKSMVNHFQTDCPNCTILPSVPKTCPEGWGWDSHQNKCRQFCNQ